MGVKNKVKRLISFEPSVYKRLQDQSKSQFGRPITAIVNERLDASFKLDKIEA